MKYFKIWLIWFFCASVIPSYSKDTGEYYFTTLDKIKNNKITNLDQIDFQKFRFSYFNAVHNGKIHEIDSEMEKRLGQFFIDQNWIKVICVADSMLNLNYTKIRAHNLKAFSLNKLNRDAKFHSDFSTNLAGSIFSSGDGKSPETAFHVYFVEEEYDVLKYLRLSSTVQSLSETKGRSYDVLECRDAEGNKINLYFDITEHMKALEGDLKF
jgi:hypothetical protein